jgi:hypothetical protein
LIVHRALQARGLGRDVEHLVAHRRANLEAAVVDRQHDEARLEHAVADRLDGLGRVLADDPHPHLGVAAPEVLDEIGAEVRARGAERAERRGARAQLADGADRRARGLDGGEHGLGVGAQRAPGLGRDEAPADALKERDAELRLEPAHLLGE